MTSFRRLFIYDQNVTLIWINNQVTFLWQGRRMDLKVGGNVGDSLLIVSALKPVLFFLCLPFFFLLRKKVVEPCPPHPGTPVSPALFERCFLYRFHVPFVEWLYRDLLYASKLLPSWRVFVTTNVKETFHNAF